MRITIEGASEEFERKLLELLAEHRHELTVTADTDWTVERAERYLRSLPAGARRFAQLVIDRHGIASAVLLREQLGKLNGPTVALSRAIPRGVREGWWPEGTRAPITVLYDPDNPSWQKAIAYQMAAENVPIFRAALARMATAEGGAERGAAGDGVWEGDAPSALASAPGWASADDVPLVTFDEDEER